jgi:hypothetical protein
MSCISRVFAKLRRESQFARIVTGRVRTRRGPSIREIFAGHRVSGVSRRVYRRRRRREDCATDTRTPGGLISSTNSAQHFTEQPSAVNFTASDLHICWAVGTITR